MKKYNYLYKITNVLNGKFYIGIHTTDNLDDGYFGSGKRLRIAIAKYGKENFIKENLEFFNSLNEALDAERKIVTAEFCKRDDTYNIAIGGYCGGSLIAGKTEDELKKWRENISKARKTQCLTDESYILKRKLIRNSAEFNKKFSETRRNTELSMTDEDKKQRSVYFKTIHQKARENHKKANQQTWDNLPIEERQKRTENNKKAQRRPEVRAKKHSTRISNLLIKDDIKEIYNGLPFLTLRAVYEYKVLNEQYDKSYSYFKSHYKRTKFDDTELVVKDVLVAEMTTAEPGKGNVTYTGIKALIVEYKGNDVHVGSGLTKEQRIAWYADPKKIIGKTICVKYFETTVNQNGQYSLRFPILKYVYENGRGDL